MNEELEIQHMIEKIFPAYLEDLKELIAIRSHRDLSTRGKGAPFGKGIKLALDFIAKRAYEMGFKVNNEDGYAIDIRTDDGEDYIGILCHIDTVEAIDREKWDSDPYKLVERNGILFGRGVNDNKGPLLLSLYVIKLLKEMNQLEMPVRLIIGGAEETTWECMDVYFERNPQPRRAFSPDGDFPIVNQEKGILKLSITLESENTSEEIIQSIETVDSHGFIASDGKITYKEGTSKSLSGKKAMSRHPERGKNIAESLLRELDSVSINDSYQENHALLQSLQLIKNEKLDSQTDKFGITEMDGTLDDCTIALTKLQYRNGVAQIELDIRHTRAYTETEILEMIQKKIEPYKGKLEIIDKKSLLFVPEETYLIQTLLDVYEKVAGERAVPITKGGASYARVLTNGIAFGPTFPGESPQSHFENEQMKIASLKKAMQIYLLAVRNLAKQKVNEGEIK